MFKDVGLGTPKSSYGTNKVMKCFLCFIVGAAVGYFAARQVDAVKEQSEKKAENLSTNIDSSLQKLELKLAEQ